MLYPCVLPSGVSVRVGMSCSDKEVMEAWVSVFTLQPGSVLFKFGGHVISWKKPFGRETNLLQPVGPDCWYSTLKKGWLQETKSPWEQTHLVWPHLSTHAEASSRISV